MDYSAPLNQCIIVRKKVLLSPVLRCFSEKTGFVLCSNIGVAQGIITGIRGLCNGLGPALYGFIFYMFHVELTEMEPKLSSNNVALQVSWG